MKVEPRRDWNGSPIIADRLTWEVAQFAEPDAIIVHEAGSVSLHAFDFNPLGGRELFFYYGAHLGSGVGTSAGVKLARPNQQVICLVGDGSFVFGPTALWNMARLELPVIVVVYNNHAYGGPHSRVIDHVPGGRMIQTKQFYHDYLGSPDMDMASIAKGSAGSGGPLSLERLQMAIKILADGQKLQFGHRVAVTVQRPNKMRAERGRQGSTDRLDPGEQRPDQAGRHGERRDALQRNMPDSSAYSLQKAAQAADVVRFLMQQGEMVTATQSLSDDMIELFAADIAVQVRPILNGYHLTYEGVEVAARVFTDPLASPTGFPFKVLGLEGTLSEPAVYARRERLCDLGLDGLLALDLDARADIGRQALRQAFDGGVLHPRQMADEQRLQGVWTPAQAGSK